MSMILPNNSEGDLLQYFVNRLAPENLMLRLYKNNYDPIEASATSDFTEADFIGYGAIELIGGTWGAPVESDPSTIAYSQQTFTSSAGSQNQPVYGYYLTRKVSGRIVGAEKFADGPYVIVNNGDSIKITPTITAS